MSRNKQTHHPLWPPSSSLPPCPSSSSTPSPPTTTTTSCPSCTDASNSAGASCSSTCSGRDKRQKTGDDDDTHATRPVSRTTLNTLPPELGLYILELLYNNVSDVFNVYHTCRHQRMLIDQLNVWYKIYQYYFPTWSLGLQGHELLAYRHGFAWVVMNDHRCRSQPPAPAPAPAPAPITATAAVTATAPQPSSSPPPSPTISIPPTTLQSPVLVESPTSLFPSGQQPTSFLDLPLPSESASMEEDSSDEDDPDDELGPRPPPEWLYFGGPVTDVGPGDIPRLLCHVQTRSSEHATFYHQYSEAEHRLVFCLLDTNTCLGTVEAWQWSCSRVGPFGGYATQYPVAQAVALKVCANQLDSLGRTRVLVTVAYGLKYDPQAGGLDMMDGPWLDGGAFDVDDDDGEDDGLNDNARFILDLWEAFDVVEVWIFIPPSTSTLAEAAWMGCRTASSSDETAYLSPVSCTGSFPLGTYNNDNDTTHDSNNLLFGNSNNNDAFAFPFLDSTWSLKGPRRLLPAREGEIISPCIPDGRRFRGRSARFITIDGEEYLFLLGLLDGQHGNTSVQIYHLSRGLVCSHQMGMFTESVAFFPSYSGYDRLAVLLNWGGNCEVWDIFEGRPVLSLYRDMPRVHSFSSRDVSPRFMKCKAGNRSQHLPCYGGTQWKNVSRDQYKKHGLRTWGIQVSRAVEGETPIPPATSAETAMSGGPFRVVTFSDAWEANHQAFQTQDELGSGRGMWETRWWHLDGNDLGPPRALTRTDLMRPADLPPAPPGWTYRIRSSKWVGVERCWMQWPPEPPLPLSPPLGVQPYSLDAITSQGTPGSYVVDAPDPRVLPRVFAHSRHCEWLTAQPRPRRRGSMGSSWSLSGGDASCKKKGPLPEPTVYSVATDNDKAFALPQQLAEHSYSDWLKKVRVKIMLVWHHFRIVATSQRGIYMVDMEEEQSQYGGQITVVQPHEVGDLVSISLAGHNLVITRLSGIDTVPLAGPRLKSMDPTLPLELIHLIIDHVNDMNTVFSLLTVNKLAFSTAVRVLWRNPFRWVENSETAREKLYSLINQLRPGVVPREHVLPGWPNRRLRPYVDYLSYIVHIEHQDPSIPVKNIYADEELTPKEQRLLKVRSYITWAACGHRLREMKTLQFDLAVVSQYHRHVREMVKLETVIHESQPVFLLRTVWEPIVQFVQSFIHAHGLERGRRLRIETKPGDSWRRYGLKQACALLNPLTPRELRVLNDIKMAHFSAHREHTNLDDIREWRISNPDDLFKELLPRLRRLESLTAIVRGCYRPFMWDVYEQGDWVSSFRTTQRFHSQPLSYPGLPLKKLSLICHTDTFASCVEDALIAFGPTLERCEIECKQVQDVFDDYDEDFFHESDDEADLLRVGEDWVLPRLRHLTIINKSQPLLVAFDSGALSNAPQLETLYVLDPMSTTGDPASYSGSRPSVHMNFAWCLPNIRSVKLYGTAACEFHPETLRLTPKLEELVLNRDLASWVPHGFSRMYWAWDWRLPNLRHLELCNIGTRTFTIWVVHRYLPGLETLVVNAQRLPVNIVPSANELAVDGGRGEVRESVIQPRHHPLKKLELLGHVSLKESECRLLLAPTIFPELQSVTLPALLSMRIMRIAQSCVFGHPCLESLQFV
ncbi:hypothetical protein BGZ73_004726 [Actinomortierella ambigua]|nr:hypothetical protein BGZ73_004726 [Actinomortierella ambigua]